MSDVPIRLPEDNYGNSGVNMLRNKVNEVIDYLEDISAKPIMDNILPKTDPGELRQLRNGNWMRDGKMLRKDQWPKGDR